jgi:hypothetical protein
LKEQAGDSPESSRRRLLKGTMAIPVIMTLHSGAALARTSNLVGPTLDTATAVKDGNGDLYCVFPTDGAASGNPVDLGVSPTVTTNHLTDATGAIDLKAEADACHNGGGIMLSATAWASIAPRFGFPPSVTL